MNLKGIVEALAPYYQHIMRTDLVNAEQRAFNLRREDVYSPYLYHIVGPSGRFVHSGKGPAAFAGLVIYSCNILCSVTQKGHSLFRKGGYKQLAAVALALLLERFGIDYLAKEAILIYMKSAAVLAFARHARSADLRKTVIIGNKHSPVSLDLIAHFDRTALRSEKPEL